MEDRFARKRDEGPEIRSRRSDSRGRKSEVRNLRIEDELSVIRCPLSAFHSSIVIAQRSSLFHRASVVCHPPLFVHLPSEAVVHLPSVSLCPMPYALCPSIINPKCFQPMLRTVGKDVDNFSGPEAGLDFLPIRRIEQVAMVFHENISQGPV
jgi:hypothetical protein